MNVLKIFIAATVLFSVGAAVQLQAQDTTLPFGGLNHDSSLPIEIVSDSFAVSQNKGTAEFAGNVVVGQGDMRLTADLIHVEYLPEGGEEEGRIGKMIASGGVTLVSGSEAAEAQKATYSVEKSWIVLEGDVILTQGGNAISGQKITVNLKDGSAKIEGRVKTIFKTGGSE